HCISATPPTRTASFAAEQKNTPHPSASGKVKVGPGAAAIELPFPRQMTPGRPSSISEQY
ncbi:MAG: hypothetical protein ACREXR_04250, partial [Gammaproteobacteria bacterium]